MSCPKLVFKFSPHAFELAHLGIWDLQPP